MHGLLVHLDGQAQLPSAAWERSLQPSSNMQTREIGQGKGQGKLTFTYHTHLLTCGVDVRCNSQYCFFFRQNLTFVKSIEEALENLVQTTGKVISCKFFHAIFFSSKGCWEGSYDINNNFIVLNNFYWCCINKILDRDQFSLNLFVVWLLSHRYRITNDIGHLHVGCNNSF